MRRPTYLLVLLLTVVLLACFLFSCSKDKECKHTAEVVIENETEATCSSKGKYDAVVKCTSCGTIIDKTTKETERLEHNASGEVKENRTLPTCTAIGKYDSVIYCLDCDVELDREEKSEEPLGHKDSDTVKENYIAPSCSSLGGYDECIYCLRCGEKLSTTHIELEKDSTHSITLDIGYSPTKTKDGLTNGSHCDLCGTVITPQEIIPAELQGTEIYADGFACTGDLLELTVPNAVYEISFTDAILVYENSTVIISFDKYGISALPTGLAPLELGENIFYIIVKDTLQNTKTYTAKIYRRSIYTVSFDTEGGSSVADMTVEEGARIEPPSPTRENYIFAGWDFDFSNSITENITATAIWTPVYSFYTVEIYFENIQKNAYELHSSETITGKCGELAEADIAEFDHFTYKFDISITDGIITEDGALVLKLYYTRSTYKITNKSKNGSVIGLGEYAYGDKVTLLADPADGYYFFGWYDGTVYLSSMTEYTFTVDRDITAEWDVERYTIQYYDGGRRLSIDPGEYTILDGKIILPVAEKPHYVFIGWYTSSNLTGARVESINEGTVGNLTFYARFTEYNYSITYHLYNGRNNSLNPDSYNISTILPISLYEPTKSGYTFLGWYTDSSLTEPITEIGRLVGDLDLYASWILSDDLPEPIPPESTESTITYMYGSEVLEHYPTTYAEGYALNLTEYEIEHYTFQGWYTDPSLKTESRIYQINKNMSGSIVLYAKFIPTPYTIVYNTNGGVLSGEYCELYDITSTFPITLPIPVKDEYVFGGWYTDAALTKPIVSVDTVLGNLVLYALYGKAADPEDPLPDDKYDIVYMYGDEKLNLEPNVYNAGSISSLAEYRKEHFTFEGWFTTPTFDEGTQLVYIDENVTGDLKLYAKLVPIEYTITYELDGGINSAQNKETYTVLDDFTFLAPSRANYIFAGWYTDKEFNDAIKSTDGLTGNITLYAKWVKSTEPVVKLPSVDF